MVAAPNPFLTELLVFQASPDGILADLPGPLRPGFEVLAQAAFSRIRQSGGRDRGLVEALRKQGGLASQIAAAFENSDIPHTAQVVRVLIEFLQGASPGWEPEGQALLAALLCHDCAYPTTADHTTRDARTEHMRLGAEAVRRYGSEPFPAPLLETAAAVIADHDTPSLGRPFEPGDPLFSLKLIHRACDRLGMVTGVESDLIRELARQGGDPASFCHSDRVRDRLAFNCIRLMEETALYRDSEAAMEEIGVSFQTWHRGHPICLPHPRLLTIFKARLEAKRKAYGIEDAGWMGALEAAWEAAPFTRGGAPREV